MPSNRIPNRMRLAGVAGLLFPMWTAIAQPGGNFVRTGPMAVARSYHAATRLPDGRVLITGGDTGSGAEVTASAELYDPLTGRFQATGDMNSARTGHTATLLPKSGKVLLVGGTFLDTPTAELYDPSTGTFESTGNPNHRHV